MQIPLLRRLIEADAQLALSHFLDHIEQSRRYGTFRVLVLPRS